MAEAPFDAEENNLNPKGNDDFEVEVEQGSSSHLPVEIDQEDKENLVKEAKDVKNLFDEFEKEFSNPQNTSFYIISQDWIKKWKKFVSYDKVIIDQETDLETLGQVTPGRINEDIIDPNPRFIQYTGYPEDKSFTNVLIKDGLQEGRDYKIITEATWYYLFREYGGVAIKRPCRTLPNGQRQLEVRLKKIQIVPLNNAFLRSVDHDRTREFKVFLFQAPSFRTIKTFKSDLVDVCNSEIGKRWFESSSPIYYSYAIFTEETLRMWKLDPTETLVDTFSYMKGKCKKSTSYEYRLDFKGKYLLKDPEITLEEAELADDDYMFLEVREQGRGWNLVGDGAPSVDKCESCGKYDELPIQCICKKVSYCSEECKFRDKRYHQSKCEKSGEEEEEKNNQMVMSENSRRGLCGLQNLGNTCFMNSGLQCLSNVIDLTNYFLSDKYLKEINETNPLGTKGKLVKKYAAFLKSLWFGTQTVHSPWTLKHAISEFQPMFSGYQQHDSQELLSFLLDGLHEDLNRVKHKPFTETIESDSQPDHEVAERSWENHLKRNQSVIVDLLHGQFKSKITCPTCERISITFDPFNSVSLPIPAKTEKEIDFIFLHANNKHKPTKVVIPFAPNAHTVADLRAETAKILDKDPKTFYFAFYTQHTKEILTDEAMHTNLVRKKKKIRNLYAVEVPEEDFKLDSGDRVDIDYLTSKKCLNYFGHPTRKKLAHLRTVFMHKDSTIREAYIKVFKQYRYLWDEFFPEDQREEWLKLNDEEAFKKVWEDAEVKPFKIHLVTNARIFHDCFFCGEKRCNNCELKYDPNEGDNMRVSNLLTKIKDPDFKLEFEVYFDNVPENFDLDKLEEHTDLSKLKKDDKSMKDGNINIYKCFEQFEEPEILGEENAWYCSKCKEHQRATKKMEIYKAPPVLMIHLKRFKSGGNTSFLSKSKITAKIDFPLENFDVGEYVINHEIPLEYSVPRITPGYLLDQANGHADTGAGATTGNNNTSETMQTENGKPQNDGVEALDEETKMQVETSPTFENKVKSNVNGEEVKIDEEATSKNMNHRGTKPLLYDLFAVVNHYGNLGFGHYTAYAKNNHSGKWYCFDDSSVSEENPDNVCTPASYVLFYKRKDWTFNA